MDGKGMQARIALVAGGVGILAVLLVAALAPAAVQALLVTISLVAFVWAAVAFVNPAWGPLPSRKVGTLVLVAGIGLFFVGGGVGSCHW